MRTNLGLIHRGGFGHYRRGTGDFVPGLFTLPQNPVSDARGVGDFVSGAFSVPQNPILDARGMGHVGCGPSCGCGPCSGGSGGMGAVDLSLEGTGIVNAVGITTAIPNWAVYAAGAGLLYYFMAGSKRRR